MEAESEKAAQRKIEKALKDGKLEGTVAEPWWENGPENERVFVQGPAKPHSTETTFEQLTSAILQKGKT